MLGEPMHWSGGRVNYYVEQGPLSATVTDQEATAMADAAAALWSAVSTAGLYTLPFADLDRLLHRLALAVRLRGLCPVAGEHAVGIHVGIVGLVVLRPIGPGLRVGARHVNRASRPRDRLLVEGVVDPVFAPGAALRCFGWKPAA